MTNQDSYKIVAVVAVIAAAVASVAAVAVAVTAVAAAVASVAVIAAAAAVAVASVAVAALDYEEYKLLLKISAFSIILSLISLGLTNHITLFFTAEVPTWAVISILFIIMEGLFLLEKNRPKKKENKLLYSAKRKIINLFKSVGIFFVATIIYNIYLQVKDYYLEILKWIGYIGAGLIGLALIILIVYGYLKLNSLKYNK
jgi:hypothetical protein